MRRINTVLFLSIAVGALAFAGCVTDDDYVCDDGEILAGAGDVSCDGYEDCYDGSDEWNCDACDAVYDYLCDDGECIVNGAGSDCDGYYDCDDLSDEFGCDGCLSDEIPCVVGGVDDCAVMCDLVDECDSGYDEDTYACSVY